MLTRIFLAFLLALSTMLAQARRQPVDPRNTYHRIVCVVSMTGSGTRTDPFRPAYAPLPVPGGGPVHSGIIAYSYQLSDDKKFALAEFVATDLKSLAPLLSDKALMAFEKGKDKREDIEKALKKYKKEFNLDSFQTRVR